MASTFSNSGIELIATGDQSGTWGSTTNTNLQIIDRLTNGVGAITLSGTTHTLSTTVTGSATLSDGQYSVLVFGGSPSGTNTVTVDPNTVQHVYIVKNSSGESVILTQGSGGNVTVADGDTKIVYCDGAGAGAAVVDITNDFAMGSVKITGGTITGITDLAVADGGTGASDAATARTNLGLAIGTNVQGYSADLAAIAALAKTDGNFIVGDGATWVVESGATARTSLGLGTMATQASNSVTITGGTITGITDIAVADGGTGLSTVPSNGQLLIGNGSGYALATLTGTAGVAITNGSGTITVGTPARAVAASGTSGTLTPNGDTTDVFNAFALDGGITLAAPSGTPVDGQKLILRLKDDGTARAITWTTSSGAYREIGITLPTTTTATKITYVGCVYNSTDSFWDVVALTTQA